MSDSYTCPKCHNYRDTPMHELGCSPAHLTGKIRIALDPGGTTGIAIRLPDGSWTTTTTTDPTSLWAFFQNPKPDEVIFEMFTTMGRVDRYMTYTIELVGGIKALCVALKIQGHAQTPQQRKGHIEEATAMLEARRKTDREHKFVIHEVDALAHLLRYEYRLTHPATPVSARASAAKAGARKSKYAVRAS